MPRNNTNINFGNVNPLNPLGPNTAQVGVGRSGQTGTGRLDSHGGSPANPLVIPSPGGGRTPNNGRGAHTPSTHPGLITPQIRDNNRAGGPSPNRGDPLTGKFGEPNARSSAQQLAAPKGGFNPGFNQGFGGGFNQGFGGGFNPFMFQQPQSPFGDLSSLFQGFNQNQTTIQDLLGQLLSNQGNPNLSQQTNTGFSGQGSFFNPQGFGGGGFGGGGFNPFGGGFQGFNPFFSQPAPNPFLGLFG